MKFFFTLEAHSHRLDCEIWPCLWDPKTGVENPTALYYRISVHHVHSGLLRLKD